MTGSLSVTITPFATTAKFEITNTSAVAVYLTTKQIRGKAVRDLGPQTFESASSGTVGEPLAIDMEYQDVADMGQGAADFLYEQRNASRIAYQMDAVTFVANRSIAKMIAALSTEPGDQVVITEPVTGITAVRAIVHSVSLTEVEEGRLTCTFGLAPAAPFESWQVEVVGHNEVEQTIRVGF
jgi:hypothetical protein